MSAFAQISTLIDFLQRQRLDAAREKRAQADLAEAFDQTGWEYLREHSLSDRDIVDFLVKIDGCCIALELKTKAQRKRIYRQMERYATHESVDALVLLTGTAMTLPHRINEKEARVVSLGAGWL